MIVVCGVFRYNISTESPAKSTLSQGRGLSTGGGEHIYIYIDIYRESFVCCRIGPAMVIQRDCVSVTDELESSCESTQCPQISSRTSSRLCGTG